MLLNEIWGRRSSGYNPLEDERREQRSMDFDKRDFKRREMEHELRHEDETDPVIGSRTQWARRPRPQQQARGTFCIEIGGKIWKKDGEVVKFFDQQRAEGAAEKIRARLQQRGQNGDVSVRPME